MDEYISKESAISIFRAKAEMAVCTPAQPYFDRAAKMLGLLPAADVAPVRHGQWLCVDTDTEQFFLCNICKKKEYWESDYCPNCGAKMDLEG